MHLKSIGVSNWNGVIFSSVTSKSPSSFSEFERFGPARQSDRTPWLQPDPGNERSSPLSLLNLEAIILDDRIAQQPVAQLIQLAPGLGSVFSRHFEGHGFAHPHTFDRFSPSFSSLARPRRLEDPRPLSWAKQKPLPSRGHLKEGSSSILSTLFCARLKKVCFLSPQSGTKDESSHARQEAFRLHLGIDLGRPDVRMAQHFLDRPSVRTPISKWVAKEWRKP